MNGHYIRSFDLDRLVASVSGFASEPSVQEFYGTEDAELPHGDIRAGLARLSAGIAAEPELAREALRLEQERVTTLAEFAEATAFFFEAEPPMDPKALDKWFKQPQVPALLGALKMWTQGKTEVSIGDCEAWVRDYAAAQGFDKLGPVVHPIRVALTGKTVGPGLFELMAALGPERMVTRLGRALELIS